MNYKSILIANTDKWMPVSYILRVWILEQLASDSIWYEVKLDIEERVRWSADRCLRSIQAGVLGG